jgi:hypothetical protein
MRSRNQRTTAAATASTMEPAAAEGEDEKRPKYQPWTPDEDDAEAEQLPHPLTTTVGQEEETTAASTSCLPPSPPQQAEQDAGEPPASQETGPKPFI